MIRIIHTKQESDLSFDKIYQDYYRRVFNYAFSRLLHREEAEDATAEVFLAVLQNLRSYDPKRGSVGTWINRIAHNAVENYCRKAYRRKEFPAPELFRERKGNGSRNSRSTAGHTASCGSFPKRNVNFWLLGMNWT